MYYGALKYPFLPRRMIPNCKSPIIMSVTGDNVCFSLKLFSLSNTHYIYFTTRGEISVFSSRSYQYFKIRKQNFSDVIFRLFY